VVDPMIRYLRAHLIFACMFVGALAAWQFWPAS
jgi:hypothetical protein